MLRIAVAGFMLIGLALAAAPSTKSADAEIKLLDKGLQGWRYYLSDHLVGMEDVWSVRDGVLVCKGEPMGYLYTAKAYKNFRLHVEWRWAPGTKPGNSGVLFRINGKPMPLPRCLEAQLQAGNVGDLYGFHGMKLSGDLNGVTKIAGNEKDPGEWNVYEVLAEGPSIKVWLNGKLVNEARDAELLAGPLALQSEGGEIHFRNVLLKPLAD